MSVQSVPSKSNSQTNGHLTHTPSGEQLLVYIWDTPDSLRCVCPAEDKQL